jgi:hypothetical protein
MLKLNVNHITILTGTESTDLNVNFVQTTSTTTTKVGAGATVKLADITSSINTYVSPDIFWGIFISIFLFTIFIIAFL